MDIERLIAQLRAERSRLDAAIEVLGRLAADEKGRSRSQKWMAKAREGEVETSVSPEQRDEKSLGQTAGRLE
jgi:hypothetical protein